MNNYYLTIFLKQFYYKFYPTLYFSILKIVNPKFDYMFKVKLYYLK